MTIFYGLATTQKGTGVVISNLPTDLLGAVNEAKRYAAKNGLTFQSVYPVKSNETKGATLTKYKKQRDRAANKR
ncbi:hypothetical protein [Paenibacillus odorifer]|uniref:hypothetical protein n=1 Tax=Paenibacillus odorifer TaxID=189426 RepID=UPI00096FB1BE|nr:hypothetical protein [Paenibacillus odorifer]OMD76863.1 hypothetical protein BSK50_14010 [Paenibacillus odorifer]